MTERPHLLLVVADLRGGGTQRVVARMSGLLAGVFDVTVATFDDSSNDFFALPQQVRRVVLGNYGEAASGIRGLVANAARLAALRRCIRRCRPSLVMSFITHTNVLCIIAMAGLRVPLVISERNDPSRQFFGAPWDQLRRILYRHASVTTANSRHALGALSHYVPRERLAYLPNPITAPATPARPGDSTTILFVGRLVDQKRPRLLLDAFSRLAASRREWNLRMVGDGPLRQQLQGSIDSLGLQNRVALVGTSRAIEHEYRSAAIFVLPSIFEGTPNALLEAMSTGLPCVISSDIGSRNEFFEDRESGLYFEGDSLDSLVSSLATLMDSAICRTTIGAAARQRSGIENAPERALHAWSTVIQKATKPTNSAL